MEMQVEQHIPAPPEKVWAALNDVETLKASIPGCEGLEVTGENAFKARVTTKIGPVKARFNFDVSLTDLDPPHAYTINAKGQGGAAGFANGSARVTLADADGETLLAYHATAQVGGKLAQLGARLIDGTARKLADEFFTNFSEIVAGNANGDEASTEDAGAAPAGDDAPAVVPGRRPLWVWVAIVGVAGLLAYYLFG